MESSAAPFAGPLHMATKGKRIGWLGDFGGATPYEPGVLRFCQEGARRFAALGCSIDEALTDYPLDRAWDTFVQLRGWMQGGGAA